MSGEKTSGVKLKLHFPGWHFVGGGSLSFFENTIEITWIPKTWICLFDAWKKVKKKKSPQKVVKNDDVPR